MTSHHKSSLRGQIAYAARVWVFVFAMHEYIRGREGQWLTLLLCDVLWHRMPSFFLLFFFLNAEAAGPREPLWFKNGCKKWDPACFWGEITWLMNDLKILIHSTSHLNKEKSLKLAFFYILAPLIGWYDDIYWETTNICQLIGMLLHFFSRGSYLFNIFGCILSLTYYVIWYKITYDRTLYLYFPAQCV